MKPTATRAGMPRLRAITAYALANCTQKPRLLSRNATMADELSLVVDVGVVDEPVGGVAEVVAQRLRLRVRRAPADAGDDLLGPRS